MTDQGGGMPPGWYQAAGDPPGTQRYWDGAQWQGGPQPVAAAGAPAGAQSSFGGGAPAELGQRFVAALIDFGAIFAVFVVGFILSMIFGAVVDLLGGIMFLLTMLAMMGFGLYNQIYLQGTTGQTFGKKQQGITLLADKTGQPVGALMAFVRGMLGGLLSQICLLDYLWMFKSDERRRLSDQILEFQVVKAS